MDISPVLQTKVQFKGLHRRDLCSSPIQFPQHVNSPGIYVSCPCFDVGGFNKQRNSFTVVTARVGVSNLESNNNDGESGPLHSQFRWIEDGGGGPKVFHGSRERECRKLFARKLEGEERRGRPRSYRESLETANRERDKLEGFPGGADHRVKEDGGRGRDTVDKGRAGIEENRDGRGKYGGRISIQERIDRRGRDIQGRSKSVEQERRQEGEKRRERAEPELAGHIDVITSAANAYVKHLVKLRQSASYRHSSGSVIVVGSIPLREICEVYAKEGISNHQPVEVLLILEGAAVPAGLSSCPQRIVHVSDAVMRKVSGVDSSQGVEAVGVLQLPTSFCNLEEVEDSFATATIWCCSPHRVLVLDAIQDPGNLGTLLRTAAAFGWDGVFLLPGCCDPFNEKALRASRGACFRIPIATGQWNQLRAFADTNRMKLYAGEPESENSVSLSKTTARRDEGCDQPELLRALVDGDRGKEHGESEALTVAAGCTSILDSLATAAAEDALCLVLGSEGQGLSEVAREACDYVAIPMPGQFESLNVAIAGGILLFLMKCGLPFPSSPNKHL